MSGDRSTTSVLPRLFPSAQATSTSLLSASTGRTLAINGIAMPESILSVALIQSAPRVQQRLHVSFAIDPFSCFGQVGSRCAASHNLKGPNVYVGVRIWPAQIEVRRIVVVRVNTDL